LLKVLKSTIDSVMDDFYQKAQVEQYAQAENDKVEAAAEGSAKQRHQQ
jgi:hypothetical protein